MKLSLLLLALAGFFAWATFELERASGDGDIVAAQRAREPDARRTAPPPVQAQQSASAAAVSGPSLFRAAQAPAPSGPAPGEVFTLVGLTGGADLRIALLRDQADQQSHRVRTGDTVGSWRIVTISERCVELSRGRRRQSVCVS